MKFSLIKWFVQFFIVLFLFSNIYAVGGDFDSDNIDLLDKVLETEFSSCSDAQNINSTKNDANYSSLILSGDSLFIAGEIFTGAGNAKAIVDSYDLETNVLNYYQTADTGFSSFSIDEFISGSTSGSGTIIGIPVKVIIPCFERIVSIDQGVREMVYIAEASLMDVLSSLQTKLDNERISASNSLVVLQERLIQEEITAFEAKLEAELTAQEMMAEIIAEEERTKRLAEFQAKLEAEKAAAAASTAAYQSKLAYDAKVNKIMENLVKELELAKELDEFESQRAEELIAQAAAKLEEEKVVGAISGEIVTVAGHESCKETLNLSDHNVDLFKLSLAGDYLYNVGPLSQFGTEFSINRWDKYISCIGSYNK